VTSPTFAIAHRYRAAAGTAVSHVDLYRLGSLEAEDPDLLADYVGADAITFVEWPPEQAAALGAPPRITVSLSHGGGNRRSVEVSDG
jgi:tRNA A37 threonylcarbamoyladenosine biosynthesis protein TsaE